MIDTLDLAALAVAPTLDVEAYAYPSAETAHAPAIARGANCRSCPLFGGRNGPVMPEIVRGAKLAVIGEAPGKQEVEQGMHFVGQSGVVLNRSLADGGMVRSQTTVTSTILCRPPDNMDMQVFLWKLQRDHKRRVERAKKKGLPEPQLVLPTDCCKSRLAHDLEQTGANTLLAVGGTALRIVSELLDLAYGSHKVKPGQAHAATISKQHGAPILLPDGRVLCSSFHPAFAMRGKPEFMPIIESEIAKAARIAGRGGKVDWNPPPFHIAPSADEAVNLCDRLRTWSVDTGGRIMIDIETDSKWPTQARLRCIGIGGKHVDGHGKHLIACIPFRFISGKDYWQSASDKQRVARAMYRLLNEGHLAFQNGNYDTVVLFRVKLLSAMHRLREWEDTLYLHHDSDWSELPHDLGFMMSQLTEAPHHKDDADAKVVDGASDRELWIYNCADVIGQLEILDPLLERCVATGQHEAYQTDRSMAPVARDMGVLGMIYDQEERFRHYGVQALRAETKLREIRAVVGRQDFNPNSVKHVRSWLYDDLKLTPPFATDGTPWDDVIKQQAQVAASDASDEDDDDDENDVPAYDKDPSTSEAALQAVINSGVPQHVEDGINALVEYRGAKKLIGTYIGLKPILNEKDLKQAKNKGRHTYTVDVADSLGNERKVCVADTSRVVWEETPSGRWPILHPNWNIGTVVTGRWSSQPNCFDAETEILTERGWVKFPELDPTTKVAQVDLDTGAATFVLPTARIKRRYVGELIHWKSKKQIDILGTPNHRIPLWNRRGERETVTLDNLKWDRQIKHAATLTDGALVLSDDEIALICAAQADGNRARNGRNRWSFGFDKPRKIERFKAVCAALGVTYDVGTPSAKRPTRWRVTLDLAAGHWIEKWIEIDKNGDKLLGKWVLQLAPRCLRAFTDEVMLWDGCATRMNHYSSSVKQNADLVQAAFTLTGRRARLRPYDNGKLTRTNWQVDVVDRDHSCTTHCEAESVAYDGYVYCVTVPTDAIIIRRGKSVTITYNCQNWPEQPVNMRSMIRAAPGHVFVGADSEQIELRLYTVNSGDKALWEAFLTEGMDPHGWNFAFMMLGHKGEAAVRHLYNTLHARRKAAKKAGTKDKEAEHFRSIAKRFVYLILYGGEKDKLFKTMSADRKPDGSLAFPGLKEFEVRRWYDNFIKGHPEMRTWQERVVRGWEQYGYVGSLLDNRKRFFIGGRDRNAIINFGIQASAGAIINKAMLEMGRERIPYQKFSWATGPFAQVHDYIGVQVPEERGAWATQQVIECMTTKVEGMAFPVEAKKIGTRWSDH